MSIVSSMKSMWKGLLNSVGLGRPRGRTADYYQKLHDTNTAYQENNWLVEECEFLAGQGSRTLMEIGCGNGLFLEKAASYFDELHGCDWALSPHMAELAECHSHLHFHQLDLTREPIPVKADLVVSADVLEHFPPESIDATLRKIDAVAPCVYHKIACYDDGHSHLTVLEPQAWLSRFQAVDRRYELLQVEQRRENQMVAVLGKNLRCSGKYQAA